MHPTGMPDRSSELSAAIAPNCMLSNRCAFLTSSKGLPKQRGRWCIETPWPAQVTLQNLPKQQPDVASPVQPLPIPEGQIDLWYVLLKGLGDVHLLDEYRSYLPLEDVAQESQ